MVRKHTIKKDKQTNYNAKTGDITVTETEEHVIIEKHDFMPIDDDDAEEDMMFVGKKNSDEDEDDGSGPALIIFNDDDKFW